MYHGQPERIEDDDMHALGRTPTVTRERILIVEDEKLLRWSLKERLSEEGYSVSEAGTGADAREQLDGEAPDLVLLDMRLPDAHGLELSGNVIRVPIPALNEERRKEYVKVLHKMAEEGRISVRHARRIVREEIHELVKAHEIGEDEGRGREDRLEKLTHEYADKIDELLG